MICAMHFYVVYKSLSLITALTKHRLPAKIYFSCQGLPVLEDFMFKANSASEVCVLFAVLMKWVKSASAEHRVLSGTAKQGLGFNTLVLW